MPPHPARRARLALLALLLCTPALFAARRVVVIKVDGLPADLVDRYISQTDPQTKRSMLPWMKYIFAEQGSSIRNFYVRGTSLSAPSWALLDTGRHSAIRGNVEYDRYSGRVFDYLNFFPFYLNYARSLHADMPGVEVLDEAGIPLLIDSFSPEQRSHSMQLLQRGVRWSTLQRSLTGRFFRSPQELLNEWQTGFEMSRGLALRMEKDMTASLADPRILYLDLFSGEYDHTAHLTEDEESQYSVLKRLDAMLGRIWTAIEASPMAANTTLILVSDHGMTTERGTYSQGYNLIRFFTGEAGGAHHVLTNRHPMQMYKLRGLDPFVSQVVTASAASSYLTGREQDYPTAKLDLDGNERAGVQLRDSDLNVLQILFGQMSRSALPVTLRDAASRAALRTIDARRDSWTTTVEELDTELGALRNALDRLKASIQAEGKVRGATAQARAARQVATRRRAMFESLETDERGYARYREFLKTLLAWRPSAPTPELPRRVTGDRNTAAQLCAYVAGLGPDGLVLAPGGEIDPERSFRRVDYPLALTGLRVRNNVQDKVGPKPVDFVAFLDGDAVVLYGSEGRQLRVEAKTGASGVLHLRVVPVSGATGARAAWAAGFPLALFEDPQLAVKGDRAAWLDEWHTEREWLAATHATLYSNAVIGIHEHFRPFQATELPAVLKESAGEADWPALLRFVSRRRELAQNDLLVVAAPHWNFNVRNFNPGGNHGSFLRSATHSVLMLAGGGVPRGLSVETPYDSLSFAPTVLALCERLPHGNTYPGPLIREILPH